MRRCPLVLLLILVPIHACRSSAGTARAPGSPTPVAEPAGAGADAPPQADPSSAAAGGAEEGRFVPVRADQAPLVRIQEALEADSLLGRRVRVSGRCTAAGAGRRAGSWTLEDAGSTIEVRGLVPSSCGASSAAPLTIFAQIEPTTSGSRDRLLLRLPD
jgi:hypothetical protein